MDASSRPLLRSARFSRVEKNRSRKARRFVGRESAVSFFFVFAFLFLYLATACTVSGAEPEATGEKWRKDVKKCWQWVGNWLSAFFRFLPSRQAPRVFFSSSLYSSSPLALVLVRVCGTYGSWPQFPSTSVCVRLQLQQPWPWGVMVSYLQRRSSEWWRIRSGFHLVGPSMQMHPPNARRDPFPPGFIGSTQHGYFLCVCMCDRLIVQQPRGDHIL